LHYRIFDIELCCGFFDARQRSFPEKFRRMNTDDGLTGRLVFVMPFPQLGDSISAVDSAIRPEFNQNDAALQLDEGKRFAVDPTFPGEFGRKFCWPDRRAEPRPGDPCSKK
jgi:hypothetical protein